ncbi:MAG: M1 family metallopeptidase, partial [Actinobacteria bacterium]|nr:M1 family metallopeptidase [Actinomycetota bacterium]
VAVAAGSLLALELTGTRVPASLWVGATGLAAAGWMRAPLAARLGRAAHTGRGRRDRRAAVVTAVATAAVALSAGALVGFGSAVPGPRWAPVALAAAAGLGGPAAVYTDRRWRADATGPTLLAIAAVGALVAVPDTEQVAVVAGAAVATAALGWPVRRMSLGPGAAAAVAVLAWATVVGGRGRPASILGAMAALGLLAAGPAAHALTRRWAHPPRTESPDRPRAAAAVVGQLAVAGVAARVAGLSSDVATAATIASACLVGALGLGVVLAVRRPSRPPVRSAAVPVPPSTTSQEPTVADADQHRLPRTVLPSRYDLVLEPDLDAAAFTGTAAIAVDVLEPVDVIVLNAAELEIGEAWLEAADGTRSDATASLDEDTERATLQLKDRAPVGPATLHIRFRGVLNDLLRGFYRSTFVGDDGEKHTIATTQFESTDARRAFPCWDEPDLKAVFSVTLVVDDGLLAISNGGEIGREATGDGRVRVRFAETIPMSTYLVAFVVGPLEATDPVDVDGTPLRIVHPPGKARLAPFALESGAFALRYFTEYFGLPYPGDKLDLVAVPDFAFGAMENLGCVTFRETALLVDLDRATQAEQQRVADVVHHEIAHMWFGDLVTMRWWNGIWLNEAFATFMEMRCTDAFRPEWDRWTDFGVSRSAAFDTDALSSTRPIEFEVVSPRDAEGMFDVLTYEKGAAVVRMLEQYLGEERFRDGIRRYMATHQLGNTETTDLWDAIEAATGEPARRLMDSWIFQGGHPVVSVERASAGTIRLRQGIARAMTGEGATGDGATGGGATGDTGSEPRWVVPVLVATRSQGAIGGTTTPAGSIATATLALRKVLLDADEASVDLGADPDVVLLNAGGSGFYRVRYAPDLLRSLTAHLGDLSALERYCLVDDVWASVLAGSTGVADLLELLRGFSAETDLSVWQRITGVLKALDRIVPDEGRAALGGFARDLLRPALDRLGWEAAPDETDRTAALRGTLFEALGLVGHDGDVAAPAVELFERSARGEVVDPELLGAAVNVLASAGDEERWARFLARSEEATTAQEKLRYLGALADFPSDALMDRFLQHCMSDAVRTQDAPYLVARAMANRVRAEQVWRFVREHWAEANTRFPLNSIPRMLSGIRTFSHPALAADVIAFLAEHPVPQGVKTVAQHEERMRVTVALREREGAALVSALAGTGGAEPSGSASRGSTSSPGAGPGAGPGAPR